MNIQPKSDKPASSTPNPQATAQQDSRARAIAKLMSSAPQSAEGSAAPAPAEVMQAQAAPESTPEAEGQNTNDVKASETPEAPKEEPKAAEEPLSSQYAQLARKERAIRAKTQELKAKEDAIAAREAALTAQSTPKQNDEASFKDRLAKDPWAVLNENGLTYDKLVEQALNQPSPETRAQQEYLSKLEAKIAALEERQEKTNKNFEETQTQQYKQAVNQIRNETTNLVSSNEAFEMIKETGSVDDVVDLIEKTFKADGVLLTVEEAATAVEEYLLEEAMKLAKIKKFQAKFNPQTSSKKPEEKKLEDAVKQPQTTMKTLTNAVGTSRQLSARERALLAFKGEKK